MSEPKIPSHKKNWQAIDIFLFSNGQQYSPPRKYHLRSEELNWWDATLGYLARSQYGSKYSLTKLYTLKGQKVDGPLELSNGAAYVAVLPQDSFIDAGYEKYIIKASRSWEKRQSRISSGISEQTPDVTAVHEPLNMENTENTKIKKPNYTLDTTNTTKAENETNVLGKPIVSAKSEEKITGTLPNTLKNLGSIKLTEKRRPNSYPNQRPPIPRRPTTPSPISKVPVKIREVPSTRFIKTIPVKSGERTGTITAQTTTLKKPNPPPKIRKPDLNLVGSQNIAPPVVKTTTPNNVGQTTDVAQVENVKEKDIIVITTPSPISKVPVKTREIPSTRFIKTIPVKSSERTGTTTAQTKTLTKPNPPPKIRKPDPNLVGSQNIAPLVVKTTTPNNVGQTTDVAQVENVEEKDIIVIASLNTSMESDIISTFLDADYSLPAKDETQKQELKSLHPIPIEVENVKLFLPVVEELVCTNSISGKLINTPSKTKDTSFDSTHGFNQYESVQYVRNPPSKPWDASNNNKVLSNNDRLNDKLTFQNNVSNHAPEQGLEMAKNTETHVEINNTPNNNITFVEPAPLQYLSTLSNKPTEEPLMVLVNKGDIVSLKLNLEVRNAEGALNTVFNSNNPHSEAKEKVSYNNISHVGVNDDGKTLHSNVGNDHPHMCCQGNHNVVLRCACCNRYQCQTEISGNDIKPTNSNAKTYFVVLPIMYEDGRYNNRIPNKFEKGNQNTESLTKLNNVTYINDTVIVTPSSAQHNRAEHEEQVIPVSNAKETVVSKFSYVTIERNEGSKLIFKLPETKTRDSKLVKHSNNISQSLRHVSEQHIPTLIHPQKQLQDRSTQTEWHNVLMEFRRTKDGHYTFHLPPLSKLRLYKIPPFQ